MTRPGKTMRRPPDAGSMSLEYGLLLPVLFLIIFGAMDTGRLIWTYTTLHRAVEASARCAAINPVACGTAPDVATRASAEAWGLPVTAENFTYQVQSCGAAVTAVYPFPFLIPWLGDNQPEALPNAITLTVSSCYPL